MFSQSAHPHTGDTGIVHVAGQGNMYSSNFFPSASQHSSGVSLTSPVVDGTPPSDSRIVLSQAQAGNAVANFASTQIYAENPKRGQKNTPPTVVSSRKRTNVNAPGTEDARYHLRTNGPGYPQIGNENASAVMQPSNRADMAFKSSKNAMMPGVPLGGHTNKPLPPQAFQVAELACSLAATSGLGGFSRLSDISGDTTPRKIGPSDYALHVMKLSNAVRKCLQSNSPESDWKAMVHSFFDSSALVCLELCSSDSSDRRELSFGFEAIPLIFKSKVDAGARDEQLFMETPCEFLNRDSTVTVDCQRASIITHYASGIVHADGKLRVDISRSKKILKWFFLSTSHKELFSRDDLLQQGNGIPDKVCDEYGLPPNVYPLLLLASCVQKMRPKIKDAVWNLLNGSADGVEMSMQEVKNKCLLSRPTIDGQGVSFAQDNMFGGFNNQRNVLTGFDHQQRMALASSDLKPAQELPALDRCMWIGPPTNGPPSSFKEGQGSSLGTNGQLSEGFQIHPFVSSAMPDNPVGLYTSGDQQEFSPVPTENMNVVNMEDGIRNLQEAIHRKNRSSAQHTAGSRNGFSGLPYELRSDLPRDGDHQPSLVQNMAESSILNGTARLTARGGCLSDARAEPGSSRVPTVSGNKRNARASTREPDARNLRDGDEMNALHDKIIPVSAEGDFFATPPGLAVFQPSDDEGNNAHDTGLGDRDIDGFNNSNRQNIVEQSSSPDFLSMNASKILRLGNAGNAGNAGLTTVDTLFRTSGNRADQTLVSSALMEDSRPSSSGLPTQNGSTMSAGHNSCQIQLTKASTGNSNMGIARMQIDESADDGADGTTNENRMSGRHSRLNNSAAGISFNGKGKVSNRAANRRGRTPVSISNATAVSEPKDRSAVQRHGPKRKQKTAGEGLSDAVETPGLDASGSLEDDSNSRTRRTHEPSKAKTPARTSNSSKSNTRSHPMSTSGTAPGEPPKSGGPTDVRENSPSRSACESSTMEFKGTSPDVDSKSTRTRDMNDSDKQSQVDAQSISGSGIQAGNSHSGKNRTRNQGSSETVQTSGEAGGEASSRLLVGKGRGKRRGSEGRANQAAPATQRRAKVARQDING